MAHNALSAALSAKRKMGGLTWWRVIRLLLAFGAVLALGLVVLVALVSFSPATGAGGADLLRRIVGPKPVAQLEAVVLTLQDTLHHISYTLGGDTPASPWDTPTPTAQSFAKIPTQTSTPAGLTPVPMDPPAVEISSTIASTQKSTGSAVADPGAPAATPAQASPTPSPEPTAWVPVSLVPMGSAPGEGTWEAYILDEAGNVLAYRTFLQPDPKRPYVYVGIVVIDLERTRLNYVAGMNEPFSTVPALRPGTIKQADMQPGILLAAFNGGFKAINGHYGAYTNGVELLPPQNGLGTLAIFKDGAVQIGEWGNDMTFSTDMLAYRQNCPLIIQDGEINPQVNNNSINDWGGTFSGSIVTFRSGVGLNRDRTRLYYFAGTGLSMPALAQTMQVAGVDHGMQLDINNYYVLFSRFLYQDGKWIADPLLPREMNDNVDRFLQPYSHDYFYVTRNSN